MDSYQIAHRAHRTIWSEIWGSQSGGESHPSASSTKSAPAIDSKTSAPVSVTCKKMPFRALCRWHTAHIAKEWENTHWRVNSETLFRRCFDPRLTPYAGLRRRTFRFLLRRCILEEWVRHSFNVTLGTHDNIMPVPLISYKWDGVKVSVYGTPTSRSRPKRELSWVEFCVSLGGLSNLGEWLHPYPYPATNDTVDDDTSGWSKLAQSWFEKDVALLDAHVVDSRDVSIFAFYLDADAWSPILPHLSHVDEKTSELADKCTYHLLLDRPIGRALVNAKWHWPTLFARERLQLLWLSVQSNDSLLGSIWSWDALYDRLVLFWQHFSSLGSGLFAHLHPSFLQRAWNDMTPFVQIQWYKCGPNTDALCSLIKETFGEMADVIHEWMDCIQQKEALDALRLLCPHPLPSNELGVRVQDTIDHIVALCDLPWRCTGIDGHQHAEVRWTLRTRFFAPYRVSAILWRSLICEWIRAPSFPRLDHRDTLDHWSAIRQVCEYIVSNKDAVRFLRQQNCIRTVLNIQNALFTRYLSTHVTEAICIFGLGSIWAIHKLLCLQNVKTQETDISSSSSPSVKVPRPAIGRRWWWWTYLLCRLHRQRFPVSKTCCLTPMLLPTIGESHDLSCRWALWSLCWQRKAVEEAAFRFRKEDEDGTLGYAVIFERFDVPIQQLLRRTPWLETRTWLTQQPETEKMVERDTLTSDANSSALFFAYCDRLVRYDPKTLSSCWIWNDMMSEPAVAPLPALLSDDESDVSSHHHQHHHDQKHNRLDVRSPSTRSAASAASAAAVAAVAAAAASPVHRPSATSNTPASSSHVLCLTARGHEDTLSIDSKLDWESAPLFHGESLRLARGISPSASPRGGGAIVPVHRLTTTLTQSRAHTPLSIGSVSDRTGTPDDGLWSHTALLDPDVQTTATTLIDECPLSAAPLLESNQKPTLCFTTAAGSENGSRRSSRASSLLVSPLSVPWNDSLVLSPHIPSLVLSTNANLTS